MRERVVHPIKWQSKYGGVEVLDAKRLKVLEEENAKLKKLLPAARLDVSTLRELLGETSVDEPCRANSLSDSGECSKIFAAGWVTTEKGYSQRPAGGPRTRVGPK